MARLVTAALPGVGTRPRKYCTGRVDGEGKCPTLTAPVVARSGDISRQSGRRPCADLPSGPEYGRESRGGHRAPAGTTATRQPPSGSFHPPVGSSPPPPASAICARISTSSSPRSVIGWSIRGFSGFNRPHSLASARRAAAPYYGAATVIIGAGSVFADMADPGAATNCQPGSPRPEAAGWPSPPPRPPPRKAFSCGVPPSCSSSYTSLSV